MKTIPSDQRIFQIIATKGWFECHRRRDAFLRNRLTELMQEGKLVRISSKDNDWLRVTTPDSKYRTSMSQRSFDRIARRDHSRPA